LGTFGRPLEGMEIRIEPVAAGEAGEILVRGPTLMEGYYGVPRATTFDAEGFFRTGDLGFVDPAGFLHFTGRLKDVIKTAEGDLPRTASGKVEKAALRRLAETRAAGTPF